MNAYVTAQPPQIAVPVQGGGLFPVRRVYCVGRNYAAHAREMGGDPNREPPFFFTKPADALVTAGADTPYPPGTENLHHEVELVLAIGRGGADIPAAAALAHIFGYAVGLDLTRRDVQEQAKAAVSHGTWPRGLTLRGRSVRLRRFRPLAIPPAGGLRCSSTARRANPAPWGI